MLEIESLFLPPITTPTGKQADSLAWQLAPICPLLVCNCDPGLTLSSGNEVHSYISHADLNIYF
jgi:hypothetical protein